VIVVDREFSKELTMNRRGFFRTTGGALLALPLGSVLVQACSGTSEPDGNGPAAPPITSGANAEYTSNIDDGHAHTFDIALTTFAAPADLEGQTSVDEGHRHAVSISAADLQRVESGQSVMVTTATSEGHTHVLTLVNVA
jgi:hypothetical protein